MLRRLSDAGCKLIVWTCREDENTARSHDFLTQAVEFLEERGIRIRSANENLMEDEFRPASSKRRKVFANIYLDDRNFPKPDMQDYWLKFELYAEAEGWLEPKASLLDKDPWISLQHLYDDSEAKGQKIWYFTVCADWWNIIQYDMLYIKPDDPRRNLWSTAQAPLEGKPDAIVVGAYRGYPVVVNTEHGHLTPFHTVRAKVTYEHAKFYEPTED